jgi:hypothetical protein
LGYRFSGGKPHNYGHFAVLGSASYGNPKGRRHGKWGGRLGNCPTEKEWYA